MLFCKNNMKPKCRSLNSMNHIYITLLSISLYLSRRRDLLDYLINFSRYIAGLFTIYIYRESNRQRLFRCFTTLQCGLACEIVKAGIETVDFTSVQYLYPQSYHPSQSKRRNILRDISIHIFWIWHKNKNLFVDLPILKFFILSLDLQQTFFYRYIRLSATGVPNSRDHLSIYAYVVASNSTLECSIHGESIFFSRALPSVSYHPSPIGTDGKKEWRKSVPSILVDGNDDAQFLNKRKQICIQTPLNLKRP